ncbi:hypothetical protein [Janthinobacterium sp. MDT1-19]
MNVFILPAGHRPQGHTAPPARRGAARRGAILSTMQVLPGAAGVFL